MSRLSFEKRRADRPVQVRVSATGASVAGAPVRRAPDEDIHDAVLNHLRDLALSHGTPIRATIHDDAAGCVVPLEVAPDGTSRMTGEPTRLPAAPGTVQPPRGVFGPPPVMGGTEGESIPARKPRGGSGTVNFRKPKLGSGYGARSGSELTLGAKPAADSGRELVPGAMPGPGRVLGGEVAPDSGPEPVFGATATPELALGAKPTPASGPDSALGVTAAPGPAPDSALGATAAPGPAPDSALGATAAPGPAAELALGARPAPTPSPELVLGPKPTPEADPEPIPPSRFDAIAEEMLAETPVGETADGAEVWTAALARVGDAVRDGEVERAAELASRAVAKASGALGPRHPEVLHLRELCAYIAYLTGDPARAFDLSLDLARKRAESGDPSAAYSNVRSAATAWRAVGDAEQALRMGRELIDVWTALAAKPGPAASDPRPLESAHTRMTRLTARAAAAEA
ncbi:tetratricopeptide repeat protein [Streptomyces sp. SID2999]|uniref:tetratricopeptide repeat protein n=1 Tax=Streptomyces sp. SID2999 TaxID=2690258 RepID=UPI00136D0B85|nr:tetratricopeptide repeat protein [Streptomyces sp. SID2999]MYZ09803.1 tetratricopeptide repeat protein [Streptomyces sp. SID2999]